MSQQYRSRAKEAWRTAVWADLAAAVGSPKRAHAMLLPSSEGFEVDAALKAGFRLEHLHAVDRSPAKMAALSRRFGNRIDTHGCDVSVACNRLANAGVKLKAASFDFMGCINDPMCREIRRIGQSGVFATRCAVGMTLQRGREPTRYSRWLKAVGYGIGGWDDPDRDPAFPGSLDLNDADAGRASVVMQLLGSPYHCDVFHVRAAGVYWSGHLSMFWLTMGGNWSRAMPKPSTPRWSDLDAWNHGYDEAKRLGATA